MSGALAVSGSIRRRLIVQLLLGAAVLAAALVLLVTNLARTVAQETQDSILMASVTSILDTMTVRDGAVSVDLPYAALSMLGNVSEDRVFYRILADGAVLTGYGDLPPPGEGVGRDGGYQTTRYRDAEIRMASARRLLSVAGTPVRVTVSVAQTRDGQARRLAEIRRLGGAIGLGFFALAALLAVVTAQSGLRPLRNLAGAVSRRGPKDLRPVRGPVPQEMAPLVGSLNRFIERLTYSLSRSEDFIAEAAHRVRTPLSTVRTQAEIALRRVERPENRAALKEMIRAIDESSRAAGQLLDHAMVTFRTDHLEREAVDLCGLARDLADRLGPVAELRDIRIALSCDGQPVVQGDAVLIENALRNVLDNAIKYSPRDCAIDIEVGQGRDGAAIRVRDQAGGFPEDELDRMPMRFARGSNAAETVGSGLGLTIAREVLEAHGGRLELSNEGEGACVTLHFPPC
ncbi:two-component system, OmpR family, sensor histidine kinase TctE [Cribrihabitans marinus]|uniref:histidine kinase n=1 Tax=Cribrihabitans marinus TaxID=1227549 RepID=A0A1H7BAV6_9RHOB|nr:sensor histidine kinase [Cribrihabitans marinus]GGH33015.1 sensor histidine kinase [Cribrihabitans marinus]SEJ71632.1 two-component system, OmpR family, sensor histidine kinase TctE [Cribrihabitans marinus]